MDTTSFLIECDICKIPTNAEEVNENIICTDCQKLCEYCSDKKHGIFIYCKNHLKEKVPKRRWSPPEECYKTLMNILQYTRNIDFSGVREEHINNGAHSKIPLRCKKCEYKWKPSIDNVINGGSGCPKCCSSKGEKALEYSCKKLGIKSTDQQQFPTLVHKMGLKIDRYIPEQKNEYLEGIILPICIEYDGCHYKGGHFPLEIHDEESRNNHLDCVERDKTKDEWCKNSNYHMVRIPYTSWKSPRNKDEEMVDILKRAFSFLKGKSDPQIWFSDKEQYLFRL